MKRIPNWLFRRKQTSENQQHRARLLTVSSQQHREAPPAEDRWRVSAVTAPPPKTQPRQSRGFSLRHSGVSPTNSSELSLCDLCQRTGVGRTPWRTERGRRRQQTGAAGGTGRFYCWGRGKRAPRERLQSSSRARHPRSRCAPGRSFHLL